MEKTLFTQAIALGLFFASGIWSAHAVNPLVPNRGLNDPHIYILGDRAYVFASQGRAATNKT